MSNQSTQIQAAPRSSILARIQRAFGKVVDDRRGATTVEYLILLAFVALAGMGAVKGLGGEIGKSAGELGKKVGQIK